MKRFKAETLFLFLLFLQLTFDFVLKKAFLPWDPARRWLELGDAVFFALYLIFFSVLLMRLIQKKRNLGNEETENRPAFFIKRPIWYILLILVCIWGAASRMMSFLEYGPL